MNSDSQTLKWDISKGSSEDKLSFIKQVEMDLSNELAEDCRNGNRFKHRISWCLESFQILLSCYSQSPYMGRHGGAPTVAGWGEDCWTWPRQYSNEDIKSGQREKSQELFTIKF